MTDEELLDFCDATGALRGTATRRSVHARGLWHRTLHLWLAAPEGGGSLLYQIRSPSAASWPGLLDASVAGHLRAGEEHRDAFRESREEIGIAIASDAAIRVGERREEHSDPRGGWNRELQGIYVARLAEAWSAFDPVDGEAAGLVRIGAEAGGRLHRGEVASIECEAALAAEGGVRYGHRRVTAEDFIPRGDYYLRMHDVAARLIGGEPAERLREAYAGQG